ncbi:Peroxiredoxin [Salinimicrobium sediminis]|uniref:Peroxiredoxin n=1 Tax=Salinimicrobium sediminis TaxID=1343891 RepID=A0A285X2Z9_9FLAO|nr:TlpA disulfide reductase family protein [Salinimicrobium sediminis]SOC79682.1 Peroxiredoxin [Salinimicrobium sediminis]
MRIIPHKNTLGLILMSLVLLACDSPVPISGKLKGNNKNNLKVYLIQPGSLQEVAATYFGKIIDSALVDPNGSFEFHNLPDSKEPVLLEIAVQQVGKAPGYLQTEDPENSNYMPIVWQGEALEITAHAEKFQKSFTIEKASEDNKQLLQLRDVKYEAFQTYLAGKEWNVKNGSQLLEKEHAILQYQEKLMQFANNSKSLLPAMVALRWVSPEKNYERVPEFLVNQCEKWKKEQPDHPWVKELCHAGDPANLPVLVGDEFSDFELSLVTKDTVALKNILGERLTIIDLWASWCAPCRKENRDVLVPLWNKYHDRGLQIIAYGLESDESIWKAAAERDGADKWIQASDLQGDDAPFLKRIRIRVIPANFILNEKGVVIAKNLHGEALKELVKEQILKE